MSVEERVLLPDSDPLYHADRTSSDNAQRGAGGWRHFPAPPASAQGSKWRPKITQNPAIKMFVDIYANVRTLPPHIRAICMVQFFSWIGWFPVLFFSTVWVGEIYTLALARAGVDTNATTAESTVTTEEATLVGFTALLYSSLLGLATIIVLPLFVAFFQRRHKRHAHRHPGTRRRGFHIGLADIWAFSLFLFGVCMFATWFTQDSVDSSVAVIGLTGFCFAVSQWVPFSLLAEEILGGNANGSGGGTDGGGGEYEALPAAEGGDEGEAEEEEIPLRGGAVRLEEGHEHEQNGRTPISRGVVFDSGDANEEGADERTLVDEREHERNHTRAGSGDQESLMQDLEHSEFATDSPHGAAGHQRGGGQSGTGSSGSIGEKAGIILGIHNVAIVIPQFLVTGLSSIIFAFFEAGVSGVQPGAGHAGAGVGGVVDAPTGSGAAAALPTDGYGGVDPDIGFDEKDGPVRMLARTVARRAAEMMVARAEGVEGGGGSPDGIGLIFRIGGVSSFVACFLCWRLARDLRRRG